MASDALDKYNDTSSTFSARHKVAILLCLFLSCAILFSAYMLDIWGPGKEETGQENHQEEEDEDYWMEEEDLLDDDWDYWWFTL